MIIPPLPRLEDESGNPVLLYQGDNTSLKFQVLNPDETPFDLTGLVVRLMAKKSFKDSNISALFDVSCTISDAVNGKFQADLTEVETNFSGRDIIVEAYLVIGTDEKRTLFQRKVDVRPSLKQVI